MARVNAEQVRKFAEKLRMISDGSIKSQNFYAAREDAREIVLSEYYPSLYASGVVDFFFAVVMHDFGFWYGSEEGYLRPIYGVVNGAPRKGSDWLWNASMKIYRECGPQFFRPRHLAALMPEEFHRWFSDDRGCLPLPDLELRFQMTRAYGRTLRGCSSLEWILKLINKDPRPLLRFLEFTKCIPGYDRDPWVKKNTLLAMTLSRRPEAFLYVGDREKWFPILDCHLMRLALRMGLVGPDPHEEKFLRSRVWIPAALERSVRSATGAALFSVIEESAKPMHHVDAIMWDARRYCPEMERPDCASCIFEDVCAKRRDLFQPVLRTTNY